MEYFEHKLVKIFIILFIVSFRSIFAQANTVTLHYTDKPIIIDGKLDEPAWLAADSIANLSMVEPIENGTPTYKTVLRILADEKNIYFGIICYDDVENLTAYTKTRDEELDGEDYIKIVLDTYRDKRNGYIFAINPLGARYDAVLSNRGEGENANWDAVWEAKTNITNFGWTAEIVIPVKSMSFKENLNSWGFNFERKIARLLEKDRWTAISRNYKVGSLSEEGLIKGISNFDLGMGLLIKLSPLAGFRKELNSPVEWDRDFSADITKRITPDISATITANTDFAETEVDARRTNLTRFPLYFPEKRTFFLEGADIYDFGLGLRRDIVPFFSRRIGLRQGTQIPIIFGSKLNGKIGGTNFGGMFIRTGNADSLASATNLGVIRVKKNILKQSNIGIIATGGDPSGAKGSYMMGADFTYQSGEIFGNKNFLVGLWALYNKRAGLSGDNKAYGIKIDYPNDLIDASFTYKYIGNAFEPSLGYVPRTGIKKYTLGFDYMPRPDWKLIRQFFFESGIYLVTDMNNVWQSYTIFTAPVHFLLESGDRFEFNIKPTGERLPEDFEIEDNVIIPAGEYNYLRYRLEFESATKRPVNGQLTWWFGDFYSGVLDQIEVELNLRLSTDLIINLEYEQNIGRLKEGNFRQELFGGRIQYNYTTDLQFSSFIQYDNESNSIGTNTRLRWTITPLTDLFVVFNHNLNRLKENIYQFDSNQLIIKLSYGIWY